MHELPIVQKVVETVLEYAKQEKALAVRRVNLEIGSLHDLMEDWVKKYFRFITKETVAENAELNILRTPVICQCKVCNEKFTVNVKNIMDVQCPTCENENYRILFGNELLIQSIEIKT